MKKDDLVVCLCEIAVSLEREINDNVVMDNHIEVRNRSRAHASLATVQAIMGDEWLLEILTLALSQRGRGLGHRG